MVGHVRRRTWRLFVFAALLFIPALANAAPATTTIRDVVYRADGLPASGTLLVSWPAFTTATSEAIAAGTLSVAIGPEGALTLDLVPNAGAIPTDTRYRIVYKLDDASVIGPA